jgi:DNA-binding FadR family transcriptional regulator
MRQPRTFSNITQKIAHDLGLGIVTGRFAETAFPSEKTLSETYGAARTVTREAVKMLSGKGLIVSRTKKGISVEPEERWNLLDPDILQWMVSRDFSLNTLIHFTEFRLGIEPNAARLAAVHATEEDHAAISKALKRLQNHNSAASGSDETLAADIAFHVAILEATRNPFHLQMREFITTALTYTIKLSSLHDPQCGENHEKVAMAIFARKPKKAEDAMFELIDRVLMILHSTSVQVKASEATDRKS